MKLSIIKQDSLERETINRNGIHKDVHSVIKNLPFQMELSLNKASSAINLHKNPLTAQLFYDAVGQSDSEEEEQQQPVGYVKAPPMEFFCSQVSATGNHVVVDMKITVLSSHHEDMFFLVKFGVTSHPELTAVSNPIRVVSKPAQLKKNKNPLRRTAKRTFNDTLKDSLSRLEQQQSEQNTILSTLVQTISKQQTQLQQLQQQQQQQQVQYNNNNNNNNDNTTQPPMKKARIDPALLNETQPAACNKISSTSQRFETHLLGLMQAYADIPNREQRSETIRKIIKNLPSSVAERLEEMLDSLYVDGLVKEIGHNVNTGSPYANFFDFYLPHDLLNNNQNNENAINSSDDGEEGEENMPSSSTTTMVKNENYTEIERFCQTLLDPLALQEGDYTV